MSRERLSMTITTLHYLFFGHCVNSSMIVLDLGVFPRELHSLRKNLGPKQSPPNYHTMTSKQMVHSYYGWLCTTCNSRKQVNHQHLTRLPSPDHFLMELLLMLLLSFTVNGFLFFYQYFNTINIISLISLFIRVHVMPTYFLCRVISGTQMTSDGNCILLMLPYWVGFQVRNSSFQVCKQKPIEIHQPNLASYQTISLLAFNPISPERFFFPNTKRIQYFIGSFFTFSLFWGYITLNLSKVYSYGCLLFIVTKISRNHQCMSTLWRHNMSTSSKIEKL